MRRVYLAGPITGCSYEGCTEWRDGVRRVLAAYDIECYSPMRGKQHLRRGPQAVADAYDRDPQHPLSTSQGILARDRWDVMSCDLLLVNLLGATRVSIGTCVEMGWADAHRKLVVLVLDPTDSLHEHSFITGLASFRVHDLQQAVELVKHILLPDVADIEARVREDREQLTALRRLREHNEQQLTREQHSRELADAVGRLHRGMLREGR